MERVTSHMWQPARDAARSHSTDRLVSFWPRFPLCSLVLSLSHCTARRYQLSLLRETVGTLAMLWFRHNRTFGGCLALFALCLQLIVSFGHVHPRTVPSPTGGAPLPVAAFAGGMIIGDQAAPLENFGHPQPRAPHDGCLICTTLSLLGAVLAMEPPALTTPLAFVAAHRHAFVEFSFQSHRTASFQTRAPPIA
jgi:hypothetical protein